MVLYRSFNVDNAIKTVGRFPTGKKSCGPPSHPEIAEHVEKIAEKYVVAKKH